MMNNMNDFIDPYASFFTPNRSSDKCYPQRTFPKRRGSKEGFCRLCRNDDFNDDFVAACNCEGFTGLLHVRCLKELVAEHSFDYCNVCGQKYDIEKNLKYTLYQSLFKWFCTLSARMDCQNSEIDYFITDFICYIFTIALLIVNVFACVVLISYFAQDQFSRFMPAVVIITGVTVVTGVLAYWTYTWISSSLANQYNAWYYWWQHDIDVKVLAKPITMHQILAQIIFPPSPKRTPHRVNWRPRLTSIQSIVDSDLENAEQTQATISHDTSENDEVPDKT